MIKPVKAVVGFLGTTVISAGTRGVSKSSLLGMYEPEVPEELKKELKLPKSKKRKKDLILS